MNTVVDILLEIKKRLVTYYSFVFFNAVFAILLSLRYFSFMQQWPQDILAQVFIVFSIFAQMSLLALIFGTLISPTILFPKKIRVTLQVIFSSLLIALLYFDTLVFAQYRFHINAVVVDLLLSGQVVEVPWVTLLTTIFGLLLLMLVQLGIIHWIDKKTVIGAKAIKRFVFSVLASLLLINLIHIWAAANAYRPVVMVKQYLPLFEPASANRFLRKHGLINEEALKQKEKLSLKQNSELNYPSTPLSFDAVDQPTDIILITIDSWRSDSFSEEVTPNLWQFAKSGTYFNNHLSSGNSTRTGIFGLFYGIAGTYWHSFLANQQSPVLIDRLLALDYQMGVFASAQLRNPEFNQTVFRNIKDLRIESNGESAVARDQDLVKDWSSWYQQRNTNQPTFSFLFFDSAHAYDFPKSYPPLFEPMLEVVDYLKLDNDVDPKPFLNRYKTSVHFVDSLIKNVLDQIENHGNIENTLIIVTGDHGQELNDNQLNYWGHNSNFTDAQVKVPFILVGPKVNKLVSQSYKDDFTSHQDIVPTLMKNYLGVTNDIQNYSVGQDLFAAPIKRDWLISSQYSGYSIISEDAIIEIGALGDYRVLDKTNRPLADENINFKYIEAALEEISRFKK